ncbi:MAG: S26 family signal peptidase, partial [Myxococcota bacterium]
MDSRSKSDEKVREGAERLAAQLQKRRERRREGASDEVWERIEAYEHELRLAISEHDVKRMEELSSTIDDYIDEELGPPTKSTWREYVESIALAIVFAFVLRGFVVEAFKITTGSMNPTLLIGDQLFVNKFENGKRVPFTNTFVA